MTNEKKIINGEELVPNELYEQVANMTIKEKLKVYWDEISELTEPLFEEFWEVLKDRNEFFQLEFQAMIALIALKRKVKGNEITIEEKKD